MPNRSLVGQYGEELAKKYFLKHGYQVVHRNEKVSHKEIDLIVKKESLLVFVEVRTRTNRHLGPAEEALGHGKIRKFKAAVNGFLAKKPQKIKFQDFRLDFVAVDIDKRKKTAKIKHFRGII